VSISFSIVQHACVHSPDLLPIAAQGYPDELEGSTNVNDPISQTVSCPAPHTQSKGKGKEKGKGKGKAQSKASVLSSGLAPSSPAPEDSTPANDDILELPAPVVKRTSTSVPKPRHVPRKQRQSSPALMIESSAESEKDDGPASAHHDDDDDTARESTVVPRALSAPEAAASTGTSHMSQTHMMNLNVPTLATQDVNHVTSDSEPTPAVPTSSLDITQPADDPAALTSCPEATQPVNAPAVPTSRPDLTQPSDDISMFSGDGRAPSPSDIEGDTGSSAVATVATAYVGPGSVPFICYSH
jgi:hypothetical protein